MEIEFIGGAYETFAKRLNAQECVNFFVHVDQSGGTSQLSLRGTPGLKAWSLPTSGEVRGIDDFGSVLYAVIRNQVYQVDDQGKSTICTGTLATDQGVVSMDHNSTETMIVDGTKGYIVSGTTVSEITDTSFPEAPTSVTFQGGYFIVTVKNSGRCYISDLNDGTSWDSTRYFNAEGDADYSLAVKSTYNDLFVFGSKTYQVFYQTSETVPFSYRPNSLQEIGLGARRSLQKLDNNLLFLSRKFQVIRIQNYTPQIISTKAIDYQIAQLVKKDDAIAMTANIDGNAFYILSFPSDSVTFCYNMATGFWNKLASHPSPYNFRWRGNCSLYFDGKNIIGDYNSGDLYELDFDTFTDKTEPIVRKRISQAVKQENKNIFFSMLDVYFDMGNGLVTGQGSDPKAMLRYSNDSGNTWSNEVWRSVGKIGEYDHVSRWHRLGHGRQRNFEITVSDPIEWVITGANLEANIGTT